MSNCCPRCNLYVKNYDFLKNIRADYCCITCRDTFGKSHGLCCTKINCNQTKAVSFFPVQAAKPLVGNCCPNCKTFKRFYNQNTRTSEGYCCQTCRTKPGTHGFGCQRIPCGTTQPSRTTQPIAPALKQNTCVANYGVNAICFYNSNEPYYEFTNFYPTTVLIDGYPYKSTEHYFQAQKFMPHRPDIAKKVADAVSARDAYNIANANNQYVKAGWQQGLNLKVMRYALEHKFAKEPFKSKLLGTRGKLLVEHTSNDTFWGDGGAKGKGQNQLGVLLMELRTKLEWQKRT